MAIARTKPKWANWIEDDERPHLVTGIECRGCRATLAGFKAKQPDEHGALWRRLNHEPGCRVGDGL